MVFEYSDYRVYLKSVFAEKTSANNKYSLRAFAQKLKLANSYLSEVISGKKPLSVDSALRIALRLELNELESQYFCLLVQLDSETDAEYRAILSERLNAFRSKRKVFDLSSEMFRVGSDWYHLAILELTFLPGVEITSASVSKRLGISKMEASVAIERLIRLELLEKDSKGRQLKKTNDYIVAQSSVSDIAFKKLHKQILSKASIAIDESTPKVRLSNTDFIPLNSSDLVKARALAENFSNEMMKLSKKSSNRNQVYCLAVHFFGLIS